MSDDYMDEAALRLKEMRVAGWSSELGSFDLADNAVLKSAYADAEEDVDIQMWWVEMNEEGVPFSVAERSPQEAIAEWLRMLNE